MEKYKVCVCACVCVCERERESERRSKGILRIYFCTETKIKTQKATHQNFL